jgi:uncharacterized membrane protein YkoI
MTTRRKTLVGAALAAVVVVGGGGIALATGLAGGDDELTGSDLDRASAAALAEVGDGRVTGAEVGDDGSAYELEVTRADGSEVDVDLDTSFQVVTVDEDDDRRGTAGPGGADEGARAADDDRRDDLTGATRDQASAAALAAVPGTVTDAEHADAGGGYEITVVTEAGAEFDIVLDEAFGVVSSTEDLDD